MAEEHRKHLFCLREIISSVKGHKRQRHGGHHHRRRKLWRGRHETESSSSISSDPPEDPITAPEEPPSARTEEPSPGLPESKNSPSGHGDDQASEPEIEEPFPGLAEIPGLLTNCFQKHNKSYLGYASCKKLNGPYIEITLIDCEYRQLITTQSSIPYVALSYVWGPNTKVVPLVEGQKLAQRVSRSIEDAMVATQYLGMRYLWADQYCINQENLAIKQRQIDEMHEVYSHAELTIIAAVGGDAEAGLAPLCSPSEAGTSWYNVDTDSSASLSSADTNAKDERLASALDAIAGSVWNTRGWTYQESYVSRRILAFHARGIYYECSAMAPFYLEQTEVSETLRASDRFWTGRSLANGPTQRAFATGPWIEILSWLAYLVGAYSRRNLTKSEDALNAFGAVLNNFDGLEWCPFADMDEWRDRDERWCIGIVQGLPFHYKPDE
ncbi:hypothetical protein PFICI_13901 [Pestalotiopsis fici W106-1]|uniref:Heterokaryon incompatibility domain-containing protein n=1 Tax=Pestalotiopsis fici (strain W106-1 / CGMCC3.15140) TaxID=1229662 RepID=W3WJC4_PESFW|nr:uncharacterized protein PFICI_13901 [Pestalotiopsis fici W106-1]ETS74035.1 hypothetical protein PFICI_13901 [Pestalotiopsis fici W106-1]